MFHRHRPQAAAAALGLLFLTASPAAAGPAPERHCVVEVTGQKADGELVTTTPRCYATYEEVRQSTQGSNSAGTTSAQAASSFILATHYDGASWTGSSTSVTGSDCLGGWLNTSSTWTNRISSTRNGCYRVRHFDGANLTGASEDTVGSGGNLWSLNDRTSSIQYLN